MTDGMMSINYFTEEFEIIKLARYLIPVFPDAVMGHYLYLFNSWM